MDRLSVIVQTVAENLHAHYFRNRGELPDEKRPAIVLFDADEVSEPPIQSNSVRPAASANLVHLTPQIIVILKDDKPHNANVGPLLAEFRLAILSSVITDTELIGLIGKNGSFRFNGCATDLGRERTCIGEMQVSMSFIYAFKPDEILGT